MYICSVVTASYDMFGIRLSYLRLVCFPVYSFVCFIAFGVSLSLLLFECARCDDGLCLLALYAGCAIREHKSEKRNEEKSNVRKTQCIAS
jgi:hypothetical protein